MAVDHDPAAHMRTRSTNRTRPDGPEPKVRVKYDAQIVEDLTQSDLSCDDKE